MALYGNAIDTLVGVSSGRVAGAAKLLKNIFRSANIALVNELKLIYDAMEIDIWEVIEAVKTKPFGFMVFYPGPVWTDIVSRLTRFISLGRRASAVSTRVSSSWQARSISECQNMLLTR